MLISLDFDGVLHSLGAAHAIHDTSVPVADLLAAGLFCHNQRLEQLLAKHGHVEIVVHSSWRLVHSEARLQEMLGPLGHRLRGITTRTIESREGSILDTIRRWQVPQARFVVLDDDPKSFSELADCLIACDPAAGINTASTLDALEKALLHSAPSHPLGSPQPSHCVGVNRRLLSDFRPEPGVEPLAAHPAGAPIRDLL
jgi:hypothetical protein